MKKKLIGTVVFLALAAGLLWKLNDAFRLKQEDGIVPMELFYEQEPGTIDVMFYGSSHTYSDINPAVLWDQEEIPSYDLAGQTARQIVGGDLLLRSGGQSAAPLEHLLLHEGEPEISDT